MIPKQREKDIQKSIMDYLSYRKIFHFRNNTGAMFAEYAGKKRFFRYGYTGSGDIIGLLPSGKFFSIEVKCPGNKPSKEQDRFIELVNANNGLAFVAYSVDDVIRNLFAGRD